MRAAFARFDAGYKHLKGVGMSDEHECRHLPAPAWNPTRCTKCGASILRPGIFWTSDPPTVPGDYLYAYRWAPGEPWVQHRMYVHEVPVDIDTSETLWLGPIPELPRPAPAEGPGQGAVESE